MTPIEEIVNDPVVKLLIILVISVGVYDAFKIVLEWIWRKLGGKNDE